MIRWCSKHDFSFVGRSRWKKRYVFKCRNCYYATEISSSWFWEGTLS